MLAEALEDDHEGMVVVRFTPWIFTGTEHLVGVLFEELGAQLLGRPSERLKKVGEALETQKADRRQLQREIEAVVFSPARGDQLPIPIVRVIV